MTGDSEARLACQFTSVRFPVALNVVVGYNRLGEDQNAMILLDKYVNDNVGPVVLQVDSLQPIDWYLCDT